MCHVPYTKVLICLFMNRVITINLFSRKCMLIINPFMTNYLRFGILLLFVFFGFIFVMIA